MGGININKPEALEVMSKKIQCEVFWNRHIFQCLSFLSGGKIFWSFYYLHQLDPKENGLQFSWIGISRLQTGKSEVAMWLMLHCSFIITTDFSRTIFLKIMYSYVTFDFLTNHIPMWSIGQWIAQYPADEIRYLVGQFVYLPWCRRCNLLDLKGWKKNKIQKNHPKYLQ